MDRTRQQELQQPRLLKKKAQQLASTSTCLVSTYQEGWGSHANWDLRKATGPCLTGWGHRFHTQSSVVAVIKIWHILWQPHDKPANKETFPAPHVSIITGAVWIDHR